jgi:hypothetical protein
MMSGKGQGENAQRNRPSEAIRSARIAGWYTIAAAIIGAIITGFLTNGFGFFPQKDAGATGTAGGGGNHAPQSSTPPPTSADLSSPAAADGPITGDWNVTYGAPATVTITLAGGTYTETAKTRVLIIPGVSCDLQPGTAIATFTRTGLGTYAGQADLWSENTCTIYGTTSMTLALSSDGNTLVASLAHGAGIPPTLTFTRIQSAH